MQPAECAMSEKLGHNNTVIHLLTVIPCSYSFILKFNRPDSSLNLLLSLSLISKVHSREDSLYF